VQIPDPIHVLGVGVHPLSKAQLLDTIIQWAGSGKQRIISHVNVHGMNLAHRSERFRHSIEVADLVFCDGHGVLWGAGQLGHEIPERLAVMDWIDDLVDRIAPTNLSIFLLGDEDGIAELCARDMEANHPGLQIAGTHHGFFNKQGPESDGIVQKINASGADILLVGFGMPLQEFWIEENAAALRPSVIMPVGATYRWYAGIEPRAPRWMIDRGFEWLSRLVRHPITMFKRYVIGNPLFVSRIWAARMRAVRAPARQ
jgi:N-acetylglucosaminyldiphosphoundecaprenol N-acetyl-beta-D-mannosaminyltransferase